MGDAPGTTEDGPRGPRVYARRWVFLLVVSLLSCSNAMVRRAAVGRGASPRGAIPLHFPQRQRRWCPVPSPRPLCLLLDGAGRQEERENVCSGFRTQVSPGEEPFSKGLQQQSQATPCTLARSRHLSTPEWREGLKPPFTIRLSE
jgi:hypothetical protein